MLDDFVYVASRGLSVVVRPLLLFWVLYIGLEEESIQLALLFTIFTSVTYLLAVEVHKNYYREVFSEKSSNKNQLNRLNIFSRYLLDVIRMGIFGSLVGFFTWYLLSENLINSLLLALIISLDYFIVEFMRYLIFAKRFITWSLVQTIRYTLPAVLVILAVPIISDEAVRLYLITYFICLFVTAVIMIKDSRLIRVFRLKIFKKVKISLLSIIILFKKRFAYVSAAFANRHTILVDRYIIYFIDTTFFTFYTLISLFLNVIPMFVDMFFIARNRARFVKRNIPILEILKDRNFIVVNVGGIMIASVAIISVMIINKNFSSLLLIQSLILLSSFTFFSISSPIYELIFWHKTMKERLIIEVSYCMILSLIGSVIYVTSISTTYFLIFMMLLHIIRFLFMCYTLKFAQNKT